MLSTLIHLNLKGIYMHRSPTYVFVLYAILVSIFSSCSKSEESPQLDSSSLIDQAVVEENDSLIDMTSIRHITTVIQF